MVFSWLLRCPLVGVLESATTGNPVMGARFFGEPKFVPPATFSSGASHTCAGDSPEQTWRNNIHLLKSSYVPLLVLNGINDYWNFVLFFRTQANGG